MVLIYQDQDLVAIDKPAGFHVHPPEDGYPVPREKVCLYQLREKLQQHVYPVHRLDAGTSGVLIFALSSEIAARICEQFADRRVQKSYWAIARGYTPEEGCIDEPLESEDSQKLQEARTVFRRLATLEWPEAQSPRHSTTRYSWLDVKPSTGRFHQIRRHFSRISHPLIGDSTHGDTKQNRFFRERLAVPGLCLRARRLELIHPRSQEKLVLKAPLTEKWQKLHQHFKSFDLTSEEQ